jgi:outer membrane immunogenic protein
MFSGDVMKKLATAIAAIALIGTPAFAADIAVKAPPPTPAPVYNWTGWYAGVNAGASFGRAKTDFNNAPITSTETSPSFSTFIFPGAPGTFSNTESPSGFIGGGQIGYNWQLSPIWVAGLEADFQGALERDTNNLSPPFNGNPIAQVGTSGNSAGGTVLTNYTTKIDWFGTVRLRAGYVWGNGTVFSYVTGGLAYGKVDLEGANVVSGSINGIAPFSVTQAIGNSQINTGWVVGFGTEGKLLIPGWTYKVESLYMDLGHLDTAGVPSTSLTPLLPNATGFITGGQLTTHTHFTDGILRVGLNYQFH